MVLDEESHHEDGLEKNVALRALGDLFFEAEVLGAPLADELAYLVQVQWLDRQNGESSFEQVADHALLAVGLRGAHLLNAHQRICGKQLLVDPGHDLEFFIDEFCAHALVGEDVALGGQVPVVILLLAEYCLRQVVDCVIAHR